MQEEKLQFLREEMFLLLEKLKAENKQVWGKMNAHQMLEHLADFFDVSTEKISFDMVTPAEHLPKYREFLYSDKEFRENTKAPATVLGEEPLPLRKPSFEAAKDYLKKSVEEFISFFQADKEKKTVHPVFGPLNFEEWVLLHYKHVRHHLRQFGLL
jgi:oxepin-CoA hydrolase/3-oxo-5,6-dehydrosuberyl-CoA semialdehyde dehydrogenase